MAQFKEQGEPFVFNFKKLLKALSGKEAVAQRKLMHLWSMCKKADQGGHVPKRRRLQPDVGDSPEYPGADIDMADI